MTGGGRTERPGTRIAVLGLGNVLMGDDALGPWVLHALQRDWEFPVDVTVQDLGTPGLDLLPFVLDVDRLILVDTVKAPATPGTIRLFRRDEILAKPPQPRVSPHDPGLKEALLTAEFSGRAPAEVLLVGVVPKTVEQGVGLSDPVREAVGAAAAEVLRELERLGAPAKRRAVPLDAPAWWEQPA